jgi:hypothetical protein
MSRQLRICCVVSCLLPLLACERTRDRSTTAEQTVAMAPAPAATAGFSADRGVTIVPVGVAQKLIRTAMLRIEVKNVQRAAHTADSIAAQRGAVIAENHLTQDTQERHEARLVIRVPADRFAETLTALEHLGDVRDQVVNTQDITREYTDLATRLAVKEQAVARLRTLLDNRTAKLGDVLEVERELTRAITELEQMKGEQRYYDQQVALSTITVALYDRAPSRSTQVTLPVAEAFGSSLDILGRSLAAMINIVAVVLPWALLALVVKWAIGQRRARTQQVVRQEPQAPQ